MKNVFIKTLKFTKFIVSPRANKIGTENKISKKKKNISIFIFEGT